ncbi:hypothetical protein DFR70_112145 [Nocardia tenerifensis]|uniref:Uncharacterized protein n=1 Tax=Nocardia tenerifensis TaxID=228006 RepID=A0A318JYQ8_9NOCA|nr:hypothetical protein DFR70_112145 [Nocardia tenerifensis]
MSHLEGPAEPDNTPGSEGATESGWHRRGGISCWPGLRAVLGIAEVVALTLMDDEALTMAVKALIAVGDVIAGAVRQKRS